MRIPKFLYGTHAKVSRSCVRAATPVLSSGGSFDELDSDFLDTSAMPDAPILFTPAGSRPGEYFLLYPLLEALAKCQPGLFRDAEACQRIVRAALSKKWATLCLIPCPNGQFMVINHGLSISFLRAIDAMWSELDSLGPRFNERDKHWFSWEATLVSAALVKNGISPAELGPYRPSMKTMRSLLTKVLQSHVEDHES